MWGPATMPMTRASTPKWPSASVSWAATRSCPAVSGLLASALERLRKAVPGIVHSKSGASVTDARERPWGVRAAASGGVRGVGGGAADPRLVLLGVLGELFEPGDLRVGLRRLELLGVAEDDGERLVLRQRVGQRGDARRRAELEVRELIDRLASLVTGFIPRAAALHGGADLARGGRGGGPRGLDDPPHRT